ncbi:MAG: metal-dependent hydrolase [Gemmatimonadaceae bacterium]|nr:metal-dependent hydrolase [Gemmatimonadaceae bacterium]MCW5827437.1 metal-dependent hydrolase [Gemmatimonadaceae bacterium]
MDPITHTMTGAVLARAGGDRLTPLAPATLMLAANAPDIDIYTVWTETSFGSIAFRRGWTHGPVFLTLLPIVVTLLVWLWDVAVRRRRNPSKPPVRLGWTFALALVGTLSHPLLDWLNTYGVRVLMPFSKTWFAGDSVFIIDPYWWALLGLTLLLARARRSIATVRFAAAVAFLYPAVLVAVSAAGDRLALVEAERVALGNVREILYQPRPGNPLAAQLIAVTSDAYHIGALSWVGEPRVRFGDTTIARGPWNDPLVRRAAEDRDVRDYLVWARYAWVRLDSANGAPVSVTFGDARFPERGFAGGLSGLRVPLVAPPVAP